jgi:hypothetical protein
MQLHTPTRRHRQQQQQLLPRRHLGRLLLLLLVVVGQCQVLQRMWRLAATAMAAVPAVVLQVWLPQAGQHKQLQVLQAVVRLLNRAAVPQQLQQQEHLLTALAGLQQTALLRLAVLALVCNQVPLLQLPMPAMGQCSRQQNPPPPPPAAAAIPPRLVLQQQVPATLLPLQLMLLQQWQQQPSARLKLQRSRLSSQTWQP